MFNNNSKGSTLLELLISLLILLVVSLALMQSALLGMSVTLENSLRDEAVNIADMRVNQLESYLFTETVTDPFLQAGSVPPEVPVLRRFRNFAVTYTLTRNIVDINKDSKRIAITVTWNYKGRTYTHGTMTIMRKQS